MTETLGICFYQVKPGGVVLSIYAQPGAKKSCWQGLTGDGHLKIRVHLPAIQGKANQALIEFLAQELSLRKMDIEILSGEFSRKKRVFIKTSKPEQVIEMIKGKI